jgi:hypothetical protein
MRDEGTTTETDTARLIIRDWNGGAEPPATIYDPRPTTHAVSMFGRVPLSLIT